MPHGADHRSLDRYRRGDRAATRRGRLDRARRRARRGGRRATGGQGALRADPADHTRRDRLRADPRSGRARQRARRSRRVLARPARRARQQRRHRLRRTARAARTPTICASSSTSTCSARSPSPRRCFPRCARQAGESSSCPPSAVAWRWPSQLPTPPPSTPSRRSATRCASSWRAPACRSRSSSPAPSPRRSGTRRARPAIS